MRSRHPVILALAVNVAVFAPVFLCWWMLHVVPITAFFMGLAVPLGYAIYLLGFCLLAIVKGIVVLAREFRTIALRSEGQASPAKPAD